MKKQARLRFIVLLLPLLAMWFVHSHLQAKAKRETANATIHKQPVLFNLSCAIYLKAKAVSMAQAQNVRHYETTDVAGFPPLTTFAAAPLFYDGNFTTGYPVSGGDSMHSPGCMAVYSFPSDQTISKIVFHWTSSVSISVLGFYYYHSEDGVSWTNSGPVGMAVSGTSGVNTFTFTSTAKHHLIVIFYGGIPITLAITEASMFDGSGTLIDPPPTAPPTAPPAPTFGTIGAITIPVIVPALAGGATSYDLQRAPDVAGAAGAWATIQAAVTPSATYTETPRQPKTRYWYRLIATNSGGSTNGSAAAATTTAIPVPTLTATPALSNNQPEIVLNGQ